MATDRKKTEGQINKSSRLNDGMSLSLRMFFPLLSFVRIRESRGRSCLLGSPIPTLHSGGSASSSRRASSSATCFSRLYSSMSSGIVRSVRATLRAATGDWRNSRHDV